MKLSKEQIKEAADYLESGFIVFYSLKNKELIIVTQTQMEEAESVITSDDLDEEYMKELDNEFDFSTIKDIYENSDDYYEFDNLDLDESFKLMREFAENVTDKTLQMKLYNALERPKPFRNFKNVLEMSDSDLRMWFDFKLQGYIDHVKRQIKRFNELVNSE